MLSIVLRPEVVPVIYGLGEPNNLERVAILAIRKKRDQLWWVEAAKEIPNRHPDPANEFRVQWRDATTLPLKRGQVRGVLHTHTRRQIPGPSYADVRGVDVEDTIGCVYHPATGKLTWYDRSGFLASSTLTRTRRPA
jgi:hypothetical protein